MTKVILPPNRNELMKKQLASTQMLLAIQIGKKPSWTLISHQILEFQTDYRFKNMYSKRFQDS